MEKSLCLLEFTSISIAFETANKILKQYPVHIHMSKRICPGKHMIIVEGSYSDVENIKKDFDNNRRISITTVHNVNEEVIKFLKTKGRLDTSGSLSIFEFKNTIDAIYGADIGIKNNNISLYKIDFSMGLAGKGIVYCFGQLADLISFKNLIEKSFDKKSIINLTIISRPDEELLKLL